MPDPTQPKPTKKVDTERKLRQKSTAQKRTFAAKRARKGTVVEWVGGEKGEGGKEGVRREEGEGWGRGGARKVVSVFLDVFSVNRYVMNGGDRFLPHDL